MTLNRITKHDVQEGDRLRFVSGQTYLVRTVIRSGSSVCLTITDERTHQTIYSYPSSQLYGAEIVKA